MSEKLKLVIADDHHILLDGLRALLQKQRDMEVLGFYDDGQKLFDALPAFEVVDIALIDINMPVMDGRELTREIKKHRPDIAVIVLSMHDDASHIMDMVDLGISGYLLKNAGDKELLDAIRTVAKGKMFFSPEVADKIHALVMQRKSNREQPAALRLTTREIEILKLIANEFSNAQIGETLFISERTVETHRKNMLRKTNNKSVVGLLRYAMEQKLI